MTEDQVIALAESIVDNEQLHPGLMSTILARVSLHFAQIQKIDDESTIGNAAALSECASEIMQDITQDAQSQIESFAGEYVR